jgi:hypothetical protein
LTVATQNLHGLFDVDDDPSKRDKVFKPSGLLKKVERANWFIVNKLNCPDVIAVQEVENINTLKLVAAADCWGKRPYAVYLLEGNDISGIDVGFLVNPDLSVRRVRQLGLTAKQQDGQGHVFDRPPLLLELSYAWCGRESINLVAVHNRSFKGLGAALRSGRVYEKRMQQARWLGSWVKNWGGKYPNEALILLGDFNALPGGEELAVLRNATIKNQHSLLNSLGDRIPESERYSYIFRGQKQAIDHILVTENLASFVQDVYYTRFNTERGVSKVQGRPISDHEGMVAQFDFSGCKAGMPKL